MEQRHISLLKGNLIAFALLVFVLCTLLYSKFSYADEIAIPSPLKPRILFIFPVDKGFPFWDSQVDFARAVCDALNFELEVAYTPKNSRNRFTAAKYLKSVVEAKSQIPSLVLTSFWVGSEEGILTYLDQKKIPLITINSDITVEQFSELGKPREKYPYWLLHLSPNDTLAGKQLAQAILNESRASRCPSSNCEVNVFAITGSSISAVSRQRGEGLKDAIKADSNSKLLNMVHGNWDRDLVAKFTKTIFLRHNKIDAFWIASDVMAYGLKDGLDRQNKTLDKNTVVGSIDWSPQSIDKIKQGEMNISLGGHFMEAGWGLILFYDYLNDQDFVNETSTIIKTEMSLLHRGNVELMGGFLKSPQWSSRHLQSYSKFLNKNRQNYNLNPKSMIMEQLADTALTGN